MAEKEWTLGALLDWTGKHLAQKDVEYPRLDAEVLLAHVAGCRRIDLYGVRHAEIASEQVRQSYRDLIRKRLEGCPVAYLVGRKEFYSLEFQVSQEVLIPRPDTEMVIIECLALAKAISQPRILDVGTGSGNLAVTLAKHLTQAQVTATDISGDALAVATANAVKHGVNDRVRFLQGDLFSALAHGEAFDFIVSNPPYIAREDIPKLPIGVRQYEPLVALDGGPGGFAVFERLADTARRYLVPGGYLILEIGAPQEKAAREQLSRIADYELLPTVRDFAGHPRVLKARRK